MEPNRFKVVAVNAHPEAVFKYELEALGRLGVEIQRVSATSTAEVLAGVGDADVVIPMGFQLRREVIEQLKNCRLIPSGGIGFDHIDAVAASDHGILVTNTA